MTDPRREFVTRAIYGSLRTLGCLLGFAAGAIVVLSALATLGWIR